MVAEKTAGEPVEDVVFTIPSSFSPFERRALLDAAEMAGFENPRIVHDGTAAALQYASTRWQSTDKGYHIIYDAGAGSIHATLVSIEPSTTSSGSQSHHVRVKAVTSAWTKDASGNELTRRIKQLWIRQFEKIHGWTIDGDAKPMMKLWREAERVKALLSSIAGGDDPVFSTVREKKTTLQLIWN